VSRTKTLNMFHLAIYWTQKVHNDIIFLRSILLPSVGHSSNHEYHCWNLQDNRAVVRIFIVLLKCINIFCVSKTSHTAATSITVFVPQKLPEHAFNCDVFCSMFLNMFEDCRLRFQYRDLLMTEVQVALRIPYLCLRSSITFLFTFNIPNTMERQLGCHVFLPASSLKPRTALWPVGAKSVDEEFNDPFML